MMLVGGLASSNQDCSATHPPASPANTPASSTRTTFKEMPATLCACRPRANSLERATERPAPCGVCTRAAEIPASCRRPRRRTRARVWHPRARDVHALAHDQRGHERRPPTASGRSGPTSSSESSEWFVVLKLSLSSCSKSDVARAKRKSSCHIVLTTGQPSIATSSAGMTGHTCWERKRQSTILAHLDPPHYPH